MRINDITHYTPVWGDRFLLDANVWLYLFCKEANYDAISVAPYESFWEKCEENNCKIYLLYVTISEITNRWLRIYFTEQVNRRIYRASEFKRYRASADGLSKARQIETELRKIANMTNVILLSDDFSELDTNTVLSIENADINDNLIVSVAERHDITVVMHDGDFAAYAGRVSILTANTGLLSTV